MGRRKNRINTREVDGHHREHHHHHRPEEVLVVVEIDSTSEDESTSEEVLETLEELENDISNVPPHVSTTGRLLSGYPVGHAHETPEQREERRQDTAEKQLDGIKEDAETHEEDVQIDRYRAQHLPADRVGRPHEMIDDELAHRPSDAYTEKTAKGDPIVRPNAHEVTGAKQSYQARHLAIKRQLGLSDDDKSITPASPHKRQ
jgi:hypothetical protein